MKVIETKKLNKVYSGVVDVHAVNDVDLVIEEGEFTAVTATMMVICQ